MGANFDYHTCGKMTPDEVKAEFRKVKEQREWDHGHGGYSGTFAETPGVMVTAEVFPSPEAAYEYLSGGDTCPKWGNAVAVRIVIPEGIEPRTKTEKWGVQMVPEDQMLAAFLYKHGREGWMFGATCSS